MKRAKNPWKTLSVKPIYDNAWISVDERQVINPSGGRGIYGKVHFKNTAIGILPLDEALNTWLVGQYRYPIDVYSWEIPEGGGLLGIDPQEEAKRELLEETGLAAGQLIEIQRMYLSNSVSDEEAILYVAKGLTPGKAHPEETEQLQIRKLPFAEALEMVMKGEITDCMSIAAILKTKLLLDKGLI